MLPSTMLPSTSPPSTRTPSPSPESDSTSSDSEYGEFATTKRGRNSQNHSNRKRTKLVTTPNYHSEAFPRWQSRVDAFTSTKVRAEMAKLTEKMERLPLEVRQMIYTELFPRGRQVQMNHACVGSRPPLVFTVAGEPLEANHLLNPKYAGERIAAEALESLYKESRFDVGLRNLHTFLQGCGFFADSRPIKLIRNLAIYVNGGEWYIGYGRENDKINAADWIDATDDGSNRHLDEYPLHESKKFRIPDSLSTDANEWRMRRIYKQAGRAGLRTLCRMSKLQTVEFRVYFTGLSYGPDLRAFIPTFRHLSSKNVAVTVSCGTNMVPLKAHTFSYEAAGPNWYDISAMFKPPSTDDIEFARKHVLNAHPILSKRYQLLLDTSFSDYRRGVTTLNSRLSKGACLSSCGGWSCARVEVDKMYRELENRMQSEVQLGEWYVRHVRKTHGVGLMEYGSLPAAEAHFKATEAGYDLERVPKEE